METMDVLGALIVGLGAAACLYALGHAARSLGHPLPRMTLPAGIALAMIGYGVWTDYVWAGRMEARLPQTVRVIARGGEPQALRPWTMLRPATTRLTLLDLRTVVAGGDMRDAQLVLLARGQAPRAAVAEADCARNLGRVRMSAGAATDWSPEGDGADLARLLCAPEVPTTRSADPAAPPAAQ